MKITLKQHGGLAAVVRKAPLTLDTNELDEQSRDEVNALARQVAAKDASGSPPPRPDEIGYTLTIEDDDALQEARSMESASTAAFSKLVSFVKENGHTGTA